MNPSITRFDPGWAAAQTRLEAEPPNLPFIFEKKGVRGLAPAGFGREPEKKR